MGSGISYDTIYRSPLAAHMRNYEIVDYCISGLIKVPDRHLHKEGQMVICPLSKYEIIDLKTSERTESWVNFI